DATGRLGPVLWRPSPRTLSGKPPAAPSAGAASAAPDVSVARVLPASDPRGRLWQMSMLAMAPIHYSRRSYATSDRLSVESRQSCGILGYLEKQEGSRDPDFLDTRPLIA